MSIKFETQTESLVFMEQVGDKNKMIIQLEDRRQTEQLELRSSGEGDFSSSNIKILLCTINVAFKSSITRQEFY